METRANFLVAGLFGLFSILLGIFFIYWISAHKDTGEQALIRFRIPGSASGLSKGSAVSFNGVRVGEVQNLYIDITNPDVAIAEAQVNRTTPISVSTEAAIGIANLAGSANIELKGGNPKERNLFDEADSLKRVPELLASPSPVSDLLQNAQDIFRKANNVLVDLESLTRDIRKPLVRTADAVHKFSNALANNVDNVDRFLTSFSIFSKEMSGVANKLGKTIQSMELIMNSVNQERLSSIIENFDLLSSGLLNNSNEVFSVVKKAGLAVDRTDVFIKKAEKTIDVVHELSSAINPEIVKETISNFSKLLQTTNIAANDISKVTFSVGQRAQDISGIITDMHRFSEGLGQLSSRVDSVLAKVEGILGKSDQSGLSQEIHETLGAYRQVAETINQKIGVITDGITRFSDRGLRDVQDMITDTSRSISRIERAITDFEKNPQKILGRGAGEVPRYEVKKNPGR